ncbi:MAG: type IV secretion system DNA-binding domain-containing protein, partial [Sulfurimonas sp.]|nr:type IV secretion system DNA-binding domain-containing protein [Sulfurimonas sp.]
ERALILSIKISFEKWGYDRNSIILNPYIEKSHLWDVMRESEGTIRTFFMNYLNGILGDKKDFFSSSAERKFNETMILVKTHYEGATSAQKWLLFIKALKDIFKEAELADPKSAKKTNRDVLGTMESLVEPLEIMAWEMQKKNKKTFVIADFFKMKNQAKLFLSNQPEHLDALTPLFSAFTAAVARYHTTLPETKTDYTVYALDEYLSFVETMDKQTRKILHTLIRGFGGVMMPGLQYLPTNDKALLLDLTSSAFVWFYFSTIEDETKDVLIKKTESEYWYQDSREYRGFNENDKTVDRSKKSSSTNLLSKHVLDGLGERFEHITYIPTHNLLYKGYTPVVELEERVSSFAEIDLHEFYSIKYKDTINMTLEQVAELKFEDLYKTEKDLTKEEKFKLSQKFKLAKDKEKFKQDNNLVHVNLDLLFAEFEQDDQILDNQMKMLTLDERFTLFAEWENIDENDFEKRFEFINKNNLWGALPGIFQFDKNLMNDML